MISINLQALSHIRPKLHLTLAPIHPSHMSTADPQQNLTRWRLILGGADADGTGAKLEGADAQMDAALGALYEFERKKERSLLSIPNHSNPILSIILLPTLSIIDISLIHYLIPVLIDWSR